MLYRLTPYRYHSSIEPAGGILGKRRGPPPRELYCIPDNTGQKDAPLYLQGNGGVPCRDGRTIWIQKPGAAQGGADVVFQGNPTFPGA